ncbi:TolC family protein [Azospirillum sp. sgz302134]
MLRSFATFGAVALLGACAIAPAPIQPEEHLARAKADFALLYKDQEPLTGPLTAHEAVARALKFNYDQQLASVEAALQSSQFDVAVMNMLPRLAASAGYNGRNNEAASSSLSVITRRQSLEPSTSQDRFRSTADLTFSWNLLDFGVGYFQARQQGDRALIAVERRRRVINNIAKEVRSAYWRTATAQRLLPKIDPLLAEAEKALQANAQISKDSLEPVLQTLEYRKNLLQVITQLRRLKSDLSVAKAQLAALVNIPPRTEFTVVPPPEMPPVPRSLSADLPSLELIALSQRPELREEAYQERVDRNNLYKEMVRMVPGLSILGGLNYDSNSFLVNNLWAEAGVRATYNLVNLISGPVAIDAAERQIEVSKVRRLALSVAVLTQVNVSYQQYLRAVETLDSAQEVARVEAGIARAVANGGLAQSEPEFERIRRGLAAVAAELDRDRAFTDLQASLANLYTSLGFDPVPASVETKDLKALSAVVRDALDNLDAGRLPEVPHLDPAPEKTSETPANPDAPPAS